MEEQIELVEELLKKHVENVSVNHWIPVIYEDKLSDLAEGIVKLWNLQNVCAQHEHVRTYLKGLNKFVKYKFSGGINSKCAIINFQRV